MSVEQPARCAQTVSSGDGWHRYGCSRRAQAGSKFCWQHNPDAEKRRRKESSERWRAKTVLEKQGRIARGLDDATVEQLEAELDKRRRTR